MLIACATFGNHHSTEQYDPDEHWISSAASILPLDIGDVCKREAGFLILRCDLCWAVHRVPCAIMMLIQQVST